MECPNCKAEMEWDRKKDLIFSFASGEKCVTVEANYCPACKIVVIEDSE